MKTGFLNVFLLILLNSILTHQFIAKRRSINVGCKCGEPEPYDPLSTRIMGGIVSKPHEFPWQALILNNKRQHCGASVINDRYVMSAGHCVFNIQMSNFTVMLGVHDRITMDRGKDELYTVKDVIIHPEFMSHEMHDLRDIALLKLDRRITFGNTIKPVCLPGQDEKFDGKVATITGWGRVRYKGLPTRFLYFSMVKVLSVDQCLKTKLATHVAEDTNAMFCAYERKKDACQGDSGGPLLYKNPKGITFQIGIISWGEKCGVIDYPGVYTRVSAFHNWIHQHTQDANYCDVPK